MSGRSHRRCRRALARIWSASAARCRCIHNALAEQWQHARSRCYGGRKRRQHDHGGSSGLTLQFCQSFLFVFTCRTIINLDWGIRGKHCTLMSHSIEIPLDSRASVPVCKRRCTSACTSIYVKRHRISKDVAAEVSAPVPAESHW
jgi:hypothetical protein